MKHYSTPEEVVSALRATKSESKRILLDTAANMIEAYSREMFRLYQENKDLYEPMTNADRIRAMSDEELAEMFHGGGLCSYIQTNDNAFCEARGDCTNCVLEWLKQPYKEDA